MKKIETEFLRESNAIEGVYDEDSLIQAQEAWKFLKSKKELTIDVILKTHKILMLNQPLQPDEKGYFRRCEVYIGGRMGVHYPLISDLLEKWVESMNFPVQSSKDKEMKYEEETCRQLHIQYETIHPFVDGNGRTGRMFMNWHRLQNGLPILVIHEGDEQWEYYGWFK
jgi:Fic family protein